MRVFSRFQLAVFLLTAAAAHADYGYGYATITGGSSPTVSAAQSLNSASGPITVSRSSTGTYVVTLANSGLGTGWTVVTTPLEAGAAYCPVDYWGSNTVTITCYGSGGVAQDNSFNVLAVSNQNDKNIAFAWADQSSAASYTPNTSYSFNPAGSIGITRASTGNYQVSFNGLAGADGGTVQITAYGSNALCSSSGWTSSSSVGVLCFSPSGTPVDSRYTIAVVAPAATPTGLAYSNTNSASPVHYNPTGFPAAISHTATGAYTVTYYGLSSVPVQGGTVLLTADSSSARCVTPSWTIGTPAFAFAVNVACYDIAGNPMDTGFELLVLPPMGYAYVEVYSDATVGQGDSVNPGAAPITVARIGTGVYIVTFPNSGIGEGWIVHTWAAASGQWCETAAWAGSQVEAACFTPAGAPADSGFEILAISSTNGESMAFAFAGNSSASSYSPNPLYSYDPAGAISITRSSAGSYQVVFHGLNGDAGTVQVAPYGSGTNACYTGGWNGATDFQASVYCVDLHGTPADTQFVITVIPGDATPPDVSYFWANEPTSASDTASGSYWYRPSGSTTIQRLGIGNYAYGGEFITAPTGYQGPATRCSTFANLGEIQCYDLSGAPADTEYDLLMMEPIPNTVGTLLNIFGDQSASAVVTTAFPALSMQLHNHLGSPSSIPVVLTAPTSGPSGTFTGGLSTVVVVTDSHGFVNPPTFTANNTPGTYTVNAYVAGSSGVVPNAQFTLTNLPLTSVTLQTSPADLPVSLGGVSYGSAPQSAPLAGGNSETIAAQSPVAGDPGTQYVWLNWSDGGALSHSITVPSSDTTYTATYKTQYQLTASVAPAGAGSASTAGNATYFDSGATAGVTATPAAGYRFLDWTGNVADTQNASTTVNMTAPTSVTAHFAASCEVLGGASATVADVAKILGPALSGPAQPDMNSDGVVNVVDVQIVLNAALGQPCQSK